MDVQESGVMPRRDAKNKGTQEPSQERVAKRKTPLEKTCGGKTFGQNAIRKNSFPALSNGGTAGKKEQGPRFRQGSAWWRRCEKMSDNDRKKKSQPAGTKGKKKNRTEPKGTKSATKLGGPLP